MFKWTYEMSDRYKDGMMLFNSVAANVGQWIVFHAAGVRTIVEYSDVQCVFQQTQNQMTLSLLWTSLARNTNSVHFLV